MSANLIMTGAKIICFKENKILVTNIKKYWWEL